MLHALYEVEDGKKICTQCKRKRSKEDFYKKSVNANKLSSICKICRRISAAKYRETHRKILAKKQRQYNEENKYECSKRSHERYIKNIDKSRAKSRNHYKKHKKEIIVHVTAYQKQYAEKHRARELVRLAIARGDLIRSEFCESCGNAGCIDSHHEDYSYPLEVRWLCRRCHMIADGRCSIFKEAQNECGCSRCYK